MKTYTVTCDACKGPAQPWSMQTVELVEGWCFVPTLTRLCGQSAARPDICYACAAQALVKLARHVAGDALCPPPDHPQRKDVSP